MTIEKKVENVAEEVVARMFAAHKELGVYDPNHSLLSYLAPNEFGKVTLTRDIILVKTFLKRYDRKNANPITPILNYTLDMEKAIKEMEAEANREPSYSKPKRISA